MDFFTNIHNSDILKLVISKCTVPDNNMLHQTNKLFHSLTKSNRNSITLKTAIKLSSLDYIIYMKHCGISISINNNIHNILLTNNNKLIKFLLSNVTRHLLSTVELGSIVKSCYDKILINIKKYTYYANENVYITELVKYNRYKVLKHIFSDYVKNDKILIQKVFDNCKTNTIKNIDISIWKLLHENGYSVDIRDLLVAINTNDLNRIIYVLPLLNLSKEEISQSIKESKSCSTDIKIVKYLYDNGYFAHPNLYKFSLMTDTVSYFNSDIQTPFTTLKEIIHDASNNIFDIHIISSFPYIEELFDDPISSAIQILHYAILYKRADIYYHSIFNKYTNCNITDLYKLSLLNTNSYILDYMTLALSNKNTCISPKPYLLSIKQSALSKEMLSEIINIIIKFTLWSISDIIYLYKLEFIELAIYILSNENISTKMNKDDIFEICQIDDPKLIISHKKNIYLNNSQKYIFKWGSYQLIISYIEFAKIHTLSFRCVKTLIKHNRKVLLKLIKFIKIDYNFVFFICKYDTDALYLFKRETMHRNDSGSHLLRCICENINNFDSETTENYLIWSLSEINKTPDKVINKLVKRDCIIVFSYLYEQNYISLTKEIICTSIFFSSNRILNYLGEKGLLFLPFCYYDNKKNDDNIYPTVDILSSNLKNQKCNCCRKISSFPIFRLNNFLEIYSRRTILNSIENINDPI